MGEILAPFEAFLTTPYRLDKAAFPVEILRHNFLHQFLGIAALPSGRLREFRFEFGFEVYLHSLRLRETLRSGKLQARGFDTMIPWNVVPF
jgi:hypothetical protein